MEKSKFFKKTLENGMKVIFEERKNSGVISLAFAVRQGGINEDKKEKGLSHFIEHLLYKGTKTRTAEQISAEIEKNGGILNGFTEEELTAYWCKLPSEKLKIGLEVLGDMVRNPLFDEKELEKERQVIFEEMKMRKDSPACHVLDKVQSCMFTGNLSLDLIGTEESMNSLNRDKIIKKFQEVYCSGNMFLCAVGEADFEELCEFCLKNFPKKLFERKEPEIGFVNKIQEEERAGINQTNMVFGHHVPNALDKANYASQILSCYLVGGMSSKLWQEIREKRNLAYAVKGACNSGKKFGYNYVFVATNKNNVEKVKKIILEEYAKIDKMSEKELEQVKEQLIGNARITKEDSQGQMLDLLFHEVHAGAEESYKFEEEIKKVKLEDVKKIAKIKDYSIFCLVPKE